MVLGRVPWAELDLMAGSRLDDPPSSLGLLPAVPAGQAAAAQHSAYERTSAGLQAACNRVAGCWGAGRLRTCSHASAHAGVAAHAWGCSTLYAYGWCCTQGAGLLAKLMVSSHWPGLMPTAAVLQPSSLGQHALAHTCPSRVLLATAGMSWGYQLVVGLGLRPSLQDRGKQQWELWGQRLSTGGE